MVNRPVESVCANACVTPTASTDTAASGKPVDASTTRPDTDAVCAAQVLVPSKDAENIKNIAKARGYFDT